MVIMHSRKVEVVWLCCDYLYVLEMLKITGKHWGTMFTAIRLRDRYWDG